jgi:hypothetical protein
MSSQNVAGTQKKFKYVAGKRQYWPLTVTANLVQRKAGCVGNIFRRIWRKGT